MKSSMNAMAGFAVGGLVAALLVGVPAVGQAQEDEPAAFTVVAEADGFSSPPVTQASPEVNPMVHPRLTDPRVKADARITVRIQGLPPRLIPTLTLSGRRVEFSVKAQRVSRKVVPGDYVVKASAIQQGDTWLRPQQVSYVVNAVPGGESALVIRYGRGRTPMSLTLPVLKRGDWTARFQITGPQGWTKAGTLGRAVVVPNVPTGRIAIVIGGSTKVWAADPGRVRWRATPGVSLRLMPKIVRNSGELITTFSAAPPGSTPRLVLTPLRGKPITIRQAKASVPPGVYRVSADALTSGTSTYLPSPSRGVIEIEPGDTERLTLDYSSVMTGPALVAEQVTVIDMVGPADKPASVVIDQDATVGTKVILPLTDDLPGGFVGIVTEKRPDGTAVVSRRPILSVVPRLNVNYTISDREFRESLRRAVKARSPEGDCSISVMAKFLASVTPSSGYAVLDADLTGIHQAGVSLSLNAGLEEAATATELAGSCSVDLPSADIALPTPVPLFMYFTVGVGAGFTVSGKVDTPLSPSAGLEVGALYEEETGWRHIFNPTIDLGAGSLSGSWGYTLTVPQVSGEIGLSPFVRAASDVADLAVALQASAAVELSGPHVVSAGERCWGQISATFSIDAAARAEVLNGVLGGEITQKLFSPDDWELTDPFWCLPTTDEPVEMGVDNCTSITSAESIAFVGAIVPCSDEHTGQTLAIAEWPEGIDPPSVLDELEKDDARRKAYVEALEPFYQECLEIGGNLIGAYEDYWVRSGIFGIRILGPNANDWRQGRRWVACDLYAREVLTPDAQPTLVALPSPRELVSITRSSSFERYKLCRYRKAGGTTLSRIACSSLLATRWEFAWFYSPFDYQRASQWTAAQRDADSRCRAIGRDHFGLTSGVGAAWSWLGFFGPTAEEFQDVTFHCVWDR